MTLVALVDDDRSHRRALSRLLRATGIETLDFDSAEAYLARVVEDRIDCVVLDLQLGGMSGFDLQARLAVEAGAPPVVFLTAHDEPETIERAAATGCAFLRKTQPGAALIDAIRRAVASATPFPKGQ
jgi:FixJ family two-component response regulator